MGELWRGEEREGTSLFLIGLRAKASKVSDMFPETPCLLTKMLLRLFDLRFEDLYTTNCPLKLVTGNMASSEN